MAKLLSTLSAALALGLLAVPSYAEMDAAEREEIEGDRPRLSSRQSGTDRRGDDGAAESGARPRRLRRRSRRSTEHRETIFNSEHQMVRRQCRGRHHAGRVPRLQLRLLPPRHRRHDGADRGQSRSARRHQGISDPLRRLGRSSPHRRSPSRISRPRATSTSISSCSRGPARRPAPRRSKWRATSASTRRR